MIAYSRVQVILVVLFLWAPTLSLPRSSLAGEGTRYSVLQQAQPGSSKPTPPVPTVTPVRVSLGVDSVSVGERFRIDVVVHHEVSAGAVLLVRSDSVLGDLEVISAALSERQAAGTSVADHFVLEVTTFALDSARVVVPVGLIAGTDTSVVQSDPVIVPVRSLVPEDAQNLKDLKPIVEFPSLLWMWVGLGVLALILAGGLVYMIWRRRQHRVPEPVLPAPPTRSSYEEARSRLSALAAYDYSAGPKPFFVELTDALRTYLDGRVGIPAPELTTRDLIGRLRKAGHGLDRAQIDVLRRILMRADEVKFADVQPPEAACRETLDAALEWLDRTEALLLRQTQNVDATIEA